MQATVTDGQCLTDLRAKRAKRPCDHFASSSPRQSHPKSVHPDRQAHQWLGPGLASHALNLKAYSRTSSKDYSVKCSHLGVLSTLREVVNQLQDNDQQALECLLIFQELPPHVGGKCPFQVDMSKQGAMSWATGSTWSRFGRETCPRSQNWTQHSLRDWAIRTWSRRAAAMPWQL